MTEADGRQPFEPVLLSGCGCDNHQAERERGNMAVIQHPRSRFAMIAIDAMYAPVCCGARWRCSTWRRPWTCCPPPAAHSAAHTRHRHNAPHESQNTDVHPRPFPGPVGVPFLRTIVTSSRYCNKYFILRLPTLSRNSRSTLSSSSTLSTRTHTWTIHHGHRRLLSMRPLSCLTHITESILLDYECPSLYLCPVGALEAEGRRGIVPKLLGEGYLQGTRVGPTQVWGQG